MSKKLLHELVDASFQEGNLIEKTVETFAKRLKRSDLKEYIRCLKEKLLDLTVYVESAFPLTNKQESDIKNFFPKKTIVHIKKPSLILGMRILNKDMIYDFTLNNRLESLVNYIKS